MRYNLILNQPLALEWGLSLAEATLFSFCYELASWADNLVIDGEVYYFAAKSKIIAELPIVTTKRDTVYRHEKSLIAKGLIDLKRTGNKDYIRITAKGKAWNQVNPDKNPSSLGNKSELNSEINPTYTNTKKIQNQVSPLFQISNIFAGAPAHPHPFTENPLCDFENVFKLVFKEAGDSGVDLAFYYAKIKNWAAGKKVPQRRVNWKRVCTDWMQRDRQANKLVMVKEEFTWE